MILAAAAETIAVQGLGAPTSKIARAAGVAEGTIFTYFKDKDELLNRLYLDIKQDLGGAIGDKISESDPLKQQARSVWDAYIAWGVAYPARRKALAQLKVSDRITETTRAEGLRMFAHIDAKIGASAADNPLARDPSFGVFVAAMMASLAETTIDFVARDPEHRDRYQTAGFEALWTTITGA